MELKPGSRWKSAVCDGEFVVVRPPSGGRAGAAWLAAQGEGSIVYLGLNGPALPVAVFAAGQLGRPFAPLNYRAPDDDLRRLLARTAPSVAIVDDDMMPRVAGVEGVSLVTRS